MNPLQTTSSNESIRNILILGASYGSLLACKLLAAKHSVSMICRQSTADLMNAEGFYVRMPIKDLAQPLLIHSKSLPGKLQALTPAAVQDLSGYDMIVLAMQEPQYSQDGIAQLMERVAHSGKPCLSIMNMPPLPYLARIEGIDPSQCRSAYADASLWDAFSASKMTLCSPDPQAFRPPDESINVLQVGLATNFKCAKFDNVQDTALLEQLAGDVEAVQWSLDGRRIDVPVKLKVYDSIFVPLAKWSMLLAGNYRCIGDQSTQSISQAVHTDLESSKQIYEWVASLCIRLGAKAQDLVEFDKYAAAAKGLLKPSSSARALEAGSRAIERVDLLVKLIARQLNEQHASIDNTVNRVNTWLQINRKSA